MDLDSSILSQLDFGNKEDHSSRTKIVNIVVISTTFTIVSIRTLIRLAIIRRLGLDDVIILFAALFQIGFSVEVLWALPMGLGKHVWLAGPTFAQTIPRVRQIVEVMFFANMTYFTSVTLIKVSIIACYIRVFPNRFMRWVCAIVGFLVVGTWFCSIFTTIFTCQRVSDQWEFDNVSRKCINIIPYYYFAAAMNAFTDVALTVAPVPLLLRIKVSHREKFILCVLFGMGLFAGGCSLVRLLSLRNLYTVDISFGSSDTLDWSTIELGVGIFCASIPSLKPLLGKWARRETAKSHARPSGITTFRSPPLKGFEMLTAHEQPMKSVCREEIQVVSSPMRSVTRQDLSSTQRSPERERPRLVNLPNRSQNDRNNSHTPSCTHTHHQNREDDDRIWHEYDEKEIGMAM